MHVEEVWEHTKCICDKSAVVISHTTNAWSMIFETSKAKEKQKRSQSFFSQAIRKS